MATTLDEVRARFGTDKLPPKPKPEVVKALALVRKGLCPSCGQATFKNLACRNCGFEAVAATAELDEATMTLIPQRDDGPVQADVVMVHIAVQAANFVPPSPDAENQPEPEPEPEDSNTMLQKLEDELERQRAIKARARTIRQQAGGGDQGGRFTIETGVEGGQRDAILQFGQHKGQRVSEMLQQPEPARYLRWILGDKSFNDTLKAIIREQLGLPKAGDD